MKQILFEDEHNRVVAFYVKGVLLWTTTYTFDDDGFVEHMVRVMRSGTIVNND